MTPKTMKSDLKQTNRAQIERISPGITAAGMAKTGLEPAASAATETRLLVTNSNYATRVAPKGRFRTLRKNYWTILGP